MNRTATASAAPGLWPIVRPIGRKRPIGSTRRCHPSAPPGRACSSSASPPASKAPIAPGRPFTGDFAGDLLYETLLAFGFAKGTYAGHADDGLMLVDCKITNAVRCVPPENKPTPAEIKACLPFLDQTIAAAASLIAIVALGRIAHDSVVLALGRKRAELPFAHGREHDLLDYGTHGLTLFDSYHCSRYNTNTGVLTAEMFRSVFARVRGRIDSLS